MPSAKRPPSGLLLDQRGNIAISFAAAAIPLVLLMGGGVDLTRYNRYETRLTSVVDAAVLALARQGGFTEEQAKTFIEGRLETFEVADDGFVVNGVDVDETDEGFIITTEGTMETIFLPLAGSSGDDLLGMEMDMEVVVEVVRASNRLELALVLDNTGSMNCGTTVSSSCTGNWSNPGLNSRISGLKNAAHKLVDVLLTDVVDPDLIKIGIVPFEGAVNIGAAYAETPPYWVDWSDQAQAKFTGRNVGSFDFSGAIGVQRVGHKWLFDKLTGNDANLKWAGCVEMRAEPHDMLDTTPSAASPDTLFVPFFWPDEPDSTNDGGRTYQNNYLNDQMTSKPPAAAQTSPAKYTSVLWQSGKKDTAFPFESGPNYGCPRPILPLTSTKASIEAAIDDMVAYPAMGTFIPLGLAWGWHVLSPTEPFTQGIAPADEHFHETIKAIVLLSDGENSVTGTSNHNKSIFNGYNYTALQVDSAYRLGSSNAATATANMNTRTATLCGNVKDAGIRLYTITFGTIPTAAQDLMRNCASSDKGQSLYYHAPDNAELENIFAEIGEHLNELHVSM